MALVHSLRPLSVCLSLAVLGAFSTACSSATSETVPEVDTGLAADSGADTGRGGDSSADSAKDDTGSTDGGSEASVDSGAGDVADDVGEVAPTDPLENELTLFAIPTPSSLLNPAGISWKTPGGLVRRVLVNEAGAMIPTLDFKRTIGHAGVRVQCAKTSTKPAAYFQGSMTNVNSDDFNKLIMDKKVGLGMLFDNVAGMIEPEAELQATINERVSTTGRMAFIRFAISPDTCQGLLEYVEAYKAANVQKNYGLAARPLYKEGAGCSAFSMSLLELANVLEPRFKDNWSFDIRVPLYTDPLIGAGKPIIGGSLHPENEVPLTRVATLTRGWASPTEEGHNLFGWDPTMMYEWIDKTAADALISKSEVVEIRGKTKGLVLNRVSVPAKPALRDRTFWSK